MLGMGISCLQSMILGASQLETKTMADGGQFWLVLAGFIVLVASLSLLVWVLWYFLKKIQARLQAMEEIGAGLNQQLVQIETALAAFSAQSQENTAVLARALGERTSVADGKEKAGHPGAVAAGNPDNTYDEEQARERLDRAVHLIGDLEEDHPGNLLEARDILRKLVGGPLAGVASTHLAEALFWLGDIATEKQEKEKFHGEGVTHGKKAVAANEDDVAAHLWFAANMGSHGLARGIMSSLFYLGDIEKHGKRAMTLDRRFFYGAPLRLLGRFYHQCPGWPIGKGDLTKGIKLLEEAVETGPEFMLNHLYLAEAYLARRKKSEARALLEQIIDTETFTIRPIYQENVKREARSQLAKIR